MVSHPQPPKKVSQARWAHPAANPQIYKGIGEAADKPPSLDTKGKQAEFTWRYSRVRGVEWWICCHYGGSGPRRWNVRQSPEVMAL